MVLGLVLAAASTCSAARSTFEMRADPRIELLGVVRRLAVGARADSGFAAGIDAWFGRYKDDPAVRAYRARVDADGRTYGLLFLYLSEPPELEWKASAGALPADMVARAGGREELDAFLAKLRAFAVKARFSEFYARHRAAYGKLLAGVGKPDRDYVGELEAYAGPLDSRVHLLVSPVYGEGGPSYIIPYPYAGPGVSVKGPFDVYALRRAGDLRHPSGGFPMASPASELLCVSVDAALAAHADDVARHEALREKAAGECEGPWLPSCASYLIRTAVFARLRARDAASARAWADREPGAVGRALAERLKEYEKDRKRYPALRDFFPRLIAVFAESDGPERRP